MKPSQLYPRGTNDGECDCLPPPENIAEARTLTTFVLRYQDAWFGMEKRVAFEAEDVAAALAIMEREPIGEWAELASGGKIICRRGFEPGGAADYWVVD
jgi:hypothetical protein